MKRAIAILEKVNRPGMDKVIEYMQKSNYATAQGGSHHTYRGGLVDHSLEVYNLMMERRGEISEESIAICAFLHDLDKTHLAGYNFRGHHPQRAMLILGKCGLYLNDDEQLAIAQHHSPNLTYFTHPLRHCLSSSDMSSTGKWKEEHTSPNKSHMRRFRDGALYKFSKCKL
jgi:hypothetical protein